MVRDENERGFTLIEIMIVLAITTMLGAVVFANLPGIRRERQIDLERDKIIAALQDARGRSIVQEDGLQWNVYFENAAESDFYALFSGTNYGTGTTTEMIYLPSSIEFNTPSATSTVSFSTRTGASASTTIIIVRTDNQAASRTITVNGNGTIDY